MKRETYRREKKKLDKEKKRGKPDYLDQAVGKTNLSQETAEFNPEELRQVDKVPDAIYQDLDTNEIYFEKQRKKQWLWSGPNKKRNRFVALILAIIAILLIVLVGPILLDMITRVLGFNAGLQAV